MIDYKILNNLKRHKRDCYIDDGNKESVADHSFSLAMLVMSYYYKFLPPINLGKALQYALVHDLGEWKEGDISIKLQALDPTGNINKKEVKEFLAMQEVMWGAPEIAAMWGVYERQGPIEARYVKALDKIDALLQYSLAPNKWGEFETNMVGKDVERYYLRYLRFDKTLYNWAIGHINKKREEYAFPILKEME